MGHISIYGEYTTKWSLILYLKSYGSFWELYIYIWFDKAHQPIQFPPGAWHRQGTAGCTASNLAGRSRMGWSVVSWNSHVRVTDFLSKHNLFSQPCDIGSLHIQKKGNQCNELLRARPPFRKIALARERRLYHKMTSPLTICIYIYITI